MRLTRDEAFDLMRRAVDHIAAHGGGTRASDVRNVARDLLGRDSESLSERNFTRILKDAHDSDIIDLRRRGDDYEVRPAVVAAPIGDQLGAAAIANAPAPAAAAPPVPREPYSRPRAAPAFQSKPPQPSPLVQTSEPASSNRSAEPQRNATDEHRLKTTSFQSVSSV